MLKSDMKICPSVTDPFFRLDSPLVRLPDILECHELSLNLLSKLMSLILEEHLVVLNILRCP